MSSNKNRKKSSTGKKSFGFYLNNLGNILLWCVLLAFFLILPLYFKNGYELIATNKYKCLMIISKYAVFIVGGFSLIYFSLWGMNKDERKKFKPLFETDVFILAFIIIAVISHLFSDYKAVGEKGDFWFYEGSLWGTSGWYMGLMTLLPLVGMYFAASRFLKYDRRIWIPVIFVSSLIFLWGILNRYEIYPIEMEYQSSAFISSLGNINWFAGYESVIAPISFGLYFSSEKPLTKGILIVPVVIADLAILLNGSDSAVFGYCVMSVVLLLVSIGINGGFRRFLELQIMFTGAGLFICIEDLLFPGVKNYSSGFADVFCKGASAVFFFCISVLLAVVCIVFEEKGKAVSKDAREKLPIIVGIAVAILVALFVLLIIINTLSKGVIAGTGSIFYFNGDWGSARGATFTTGVYTFEGMNFWKKLIGAGPDCFYFAQKDCTKAYDYAVGYFDGSRLTNAHCEFLTLLVNVGIFGALSFVGICAASIKSYVKRITDNPELIIFVLSIVYYLSNNLFSFEQVTSTPFLFLMLGIGGAALVSVKKSA